MNIETSKIGIAGTTDLDGCYGLSWIIRVDPSDP
jgi:hypothetical protein